MLIALCRALAFAVLFAIPALAQAEGRPVEALRKEAEERVRAMASRFDGALKEAIEVFRTKNPERDAADLRRAQDSLKPWAGPFSAQILNALNAAAGEPRVHQQLLLVLATRGGPEIAKSLLDLAERAEEDRAHELLMSFRAMPAPGPDALERLVKLLTGPFAAKSRLAAEALTALAIHRHPAAAGLASERLSADSPILRRSAAWALAERSTERREDGKKLLSVALNDQDPSVRTTALEGLARFPDHPEVQRGLGELIETEEERNLLTAALTALATAGHREQSRRPLFAMISKENLPEELRERAATQLYLFGDARGVKLLVRGLERSASERSRDFDAQKQVADAYFRLQAYEEALESYEKALQRARDREYEVQIPVARCLARLQRFPAAAKMLQAAGYREDWSRFADEADFAAMRKDSRYAANFEKRP